MLRLFFALLIALPAFAKTPIDLMLEGRYVEARAILDSTNAEPRYRVLLDAMTEPDAVRACSLYAAISQHYPQTDCDTLAQTRLQMAAAMGVPITSPEKVQQSPEPPATPAPEPAAVSVIEPFPTPPKMEAEPMATAVVPGATTATISVEKSPPPPIVEEPKPATVPVPAPEPKVKAETLVPNDKPAPHPGSWFVQVGAFGNQDNARKLAAKLEQAGYGTALVPKTTDGKELLQVRVGGYPDRESCKAAATEIKAKYNLPASLVIQ